MPKDETVQPDVVEETALSEEATSEGAEETPQEQPFTEAQQTKLNEMIAQAKTDAEQAGFQKGSRDMQGKKDREVAQAQREAKYFQTLSGSYDSGDLTPEEAEARRNKAELAALKGERASELRSQQAQAAVDVFEKTLTGYIKDLGVNPDDVDWGADIPITNPSYFQTRQERILSSVAKLQKDSSKREKDGLEQRIKDLEAGANKEADSVDTGASGGAAGSDKDFLARWGSGDLPATKENLARAVKLQNT